MSFSAKQSTYCPSASDFSQVATWSIRGVVTSTESTEQSDELAPSQCLPEAHPPHQNRKPRPAKWNVQFALQYSGTAHGSKRGPYGPLVELPCLVCCSLGSGRSEPISIDQLGRAPASSTSRPRRRAAAPSASRESGRSRSGRYSNRCRRPAVRDA